MRVSTALLLVAIVALAGCTAVAPPGATADDSDLGTVDGVAYDEPLEADNRTEVDATEADRVARRAMARLERDRGLAFDRRPDIEIVTRQEFREREVGFAPRTDRFDEVRWRATHVVGENEDLDAAFDALYGDTVQGYYTGGDGGRIVLIVEDEDAFTVPRGTLVHELVHALQDQRLTLSRATSTTDENLAWQGLVEGEADLLTSEYEGRCASGEYRCVPGTAANSSGAAYNRGLFVSIFVGYGEGPSFVAHLRERGGWPAVDEAYDEPPRSSAELIEPERYPFDPQAVSVPDRSNAEWQPIEREGQRRSDTLGAASLYAMFWYNGVIERDHFTDTDSVSGVTYDHPLVTGWAGDRLVAYERGDETAYVLRTTWRNATEADRFAGGYRDLLEELDAEAIGDDTYAVPDGGFEGAYRIDRDGETVTIVHAPTVEELDGVHSRVASTPEISWGIAGPADTRQTRCARCSH